MVSGLSKLDEFTRSLSSHTLRGRWSFFLTPESTRSSRIDDLALGGLVRFAGQRAFFWMERLTHQVDADVAGGKLAGLTHCDFDGYERPAILDNTPLCGDRHAFLPGPKDWRMCVVSAARSLVLGTPLLEQAQA
jgi:hypothetical protein